MGPQRQPNANSESVDNYLKAIFVLGGPEESRVPSMALAQRLGVAPASVTNMLQKLAAGSPPMVEYERHHGVQLSPAGKRRALEVIRHHRLIETFLHEVLDYPIEEVHEEAERLEHFISERFEERIDARLGHPKFDPHGHCIPAFDGAMPQSDSIPLTQVAEAGTYVVESLADHDAALLRTLRESGVGPGVRLRLAKKGAGVSVRLEGSSTTLQLEAAAAKGVRVRPAGE